MERIQYIDEVSLGQQIPPLTKEPVTEVQLVRYAGASGDFNPLHTVHEVGVKAGFGGVIAHGLLIMGFVAQAVTQWIPNRCLMRMRVRFTGVTRPGDVITVTGKVNERDEATGTIVCSVQAKDQNGDVKVKGSFEAKLQKRQS